MGKQSRLKRERREAAQAGKENASGQTAKELEQRLSSFINEKRESLDAEDLEILEELLEAARTTVRLYHGEAQERLRAQARGEVVTTRWQVTPGVFDRLSAKVVRIVQLRKKWREPDKPVRKAS